jgi:hypothetical protein
LVNHCKHAQKVLIHGASGLAAIRNPGVKPEERDLRTRMQFEVKGIGVAMDDLISVVDRPVD